MMFKRSVTILIAIMVTFLIASTVVEAREKHRYPISGSRYLDRVIATVSDKYGVDPLLVHAIVRQESDYDIYAVSHKGAQGLMQLMPITQKELGVRNPFDPWQNVDGGVRYMLQQLLYFRSLDRALAAYNAGPTAEMRRSRPRETVTYIHRVNAEFARLRRCQKGVQSVSCTQ